ncbi:MAG: hypothetical protein WCW04_02680 [Candidatus Paceibacterota bacterium]
MTDYKNYLPSKKFQAIVLIIVVFIALFFTVKGIVSLIKSKKLTSKEPAKITVGEVIQKDSNSNGIPDWEEYLWGLDPNKDGVANKEFIISKKNTLAQSGEMTPTDDSKTIAENDILSRQFFATIMSLQQTGELSTDSMQSISDAVGQKIEATPIANIYSKSMLKIVADSATANENYHAAFSSLVTQYENADIGGELTLISQGIGNNDPQALAAAQSVASAYRSFASDLIKIPVPDSAFNAHLNLANDYEKTAQSIEGLTKTLTDPIIGMKAILNYKQYSDAIVSDLNRLATVLQ